jgi:membrane-associated phospholipid phosphatase
VHRRFLPWALSSSDHATPGAAGPSEQGLRLLAVAWCTGLVAFIALSLAAHEHSRLPGDEWLAGQLQDVDFIGNDVLEEGFDVVGNTAVALLLGLVLSALFFPLGQYHLAVLAPAILLWRPLGPQLKELVERPRPDESDVIVREMAEGLSFPSGHALGATLILGVAIIVAENLLAGRARRAAQALCVLGILLVGAERVYDGAHWPSDVLGGYLMGALIVVGVVGLVGILERRVGR